jgi:hypothetical protein
MISFPADAGLPRIHSGAALKLMTASLPIISVPAAGVR